MKFKLNDTVKITLGKDRGKVGKIEKILVKKNQVVVAGLNLYRKHVKKSSQGKAGSIMALPRPLALAKIALVCPQCHQPTRIGYQGKANKKIRICQKCEQPL